MKKFLIIDDQQDNLTTIEAILKNYLPKSVVFTALSGKEGIDIAVKEQPDTILLDSIMPGMDGYKVCIKLRADELTKHIPIIMITDIKINAENRIKGLECGADAFLSKPVDSAELIAQINVMLRIKSAEKYYLFFEHNSAVILFINPDNKKIVFANNAAVSFYGYNYNQLVGMDIGKINTLSKKIIKETIKKAKQKESNHFILKHRLADGRMCDVEIFQSIIMFHNQELFSIIVHDITERRRAENTLRESEEKFKNVFNGINGAAFVHPLNVEGFNNFIEANDSACKRYGYTRDEFLNLSAKDISAPADVILRGEMEERKKLTEMSSLTFEAEHITKKGEKFPVEISSNIFTIKEKKFILSIINDISKRKLAEEKLRESEMLFRTLISAVPDIIIRTDINGDIVFTNDAVLKVFPSLTKANIIGKNMMSFISEKDRPRAVENTKLMFEGVLGIKEYQLKFDNDNYYDFAVNGEVLRDSNSKPMGMVYVLRNITKYKQVENNIRKRNEELEVFNKMTVGRELKMIELKKEINILLEKIGKKPTYKIIE